MFNMYTTMNWGKQAAREEKSMEKSSKIHLLVHLFENCSFAPNLTKLKLFQLSVNSIRAIESRDFFFWTISLQQ